MKGQFLKLLAKKKGQNPQKGMFSISLTIPMAACLGVILLSAVVWAFFMGLMVGRGQNPEAKLASLAGLEQVEPDQAKADMEASQADVAEAVSAEKMEPPKDARQFQRPSGEQMAAWPEAEKPKPTPGPDAAPAASQSAKRQAIAKPVGPQYDYLYQAAAFRSFNEAENLRAKLSQDGVRARTSKSGKVYLVLVSMRGRESDVPALFAKLSGLKLGRPLLLSRKEAAKSAPAKKAKR